MPHHAGRNPSFPHKPGHWSSPPTRQPDDLKMHVVWWPTLSHLLPPSRPPPLRAKAAVLAVAQVGLHALLSPPRGPLLRGPLLRVSLGLSPGAVNCPVCAVVLPGDGTCSTREPRVSANPGPFPRLSGLSETMATPRRDQRHTEQTSEGTASRSGRFSASDRPGFFGNREAGPRREPGRPGPAVRPLHHAVALARASVGDRDPLRALPALGTGQRLSRPRATAHARSEGATAGPPRAASRAPASWGGAAPALPWDPSSGTGGCGGHVSARGAP